MRRAHADVPASIASPADGQFDFASLARAVWQRKYRIMLPAILVAVISALVVSMLTPRYRSETRVLIENRESVYNRPEADRNNPTADRVLLDQEAMASQVQLALSRDLARKIVDSMKLADRPEFNPNASSGSVFGELLSLIGLARIPQKNAAPDERVLERFYERLSVYQIEKSRVIAIEFRSEDPDLAAQVANAVADEFLVVQQAAKKDSMRQARG
jgi:polysaccharide biosynthesis transport protein